MLPAPPSHEFAAVGGAHQPDYSDAGAVRDAVQQAVRRLGGFARFLAPGARVLIKPNFVAAAAAEEAATTHPVIIAETARLLRQAGAAEVLIGDAPAFGSARAVARACGLLPLLEDAGARVVEFRQARKVQGGLDNGRFASLPLAEEVLRCDLVVNLAKPKAHAQMVFTGAVKNLYGCVPGRRKALMHCQVGNSRQVFARMLNDVARSLPPALHLLDGIVAMEGQGPRSGSPRPWGWVLASANPWALDWVAAEAFGYSPEEIPCLEAGRRLDLWSPDRVRPLLPEGAALALADWKKAYLLDITFNPLRLVRGYIRHQLLMRSGRSEAPAAAHG